MTAKKTTKHRPAPVDLSALYTAIDRLATLQPDTVAALSNIVHHIVGGDARRATGKGGA